MSPSEAARLWIVSPRQAPRVAKRLGRGSEVSWCYLGWDVQRRARLQRRLARSQMIRIGAQLNRLAGELRQPFLDWVAQIGRHQPDHLTWWASRLASKSPLQTDCFSLLCYRQLVQSWMGQAQGAFPCLVVVEDPWLARVLRKQAQAHGDVKVLAGGGTSIVWETLLWCLRAMWAKVAFLAWASWMLWRVRVVCPRPPLGAQRSMILLYTWIDGRCFAKEGTFQDPYTGRLEALLTRQGHLVRRLTPLQLGIRSGLLHRLKPFSAQFLVAPRYATASDIARAAGSWFWIEAIPHVRRFQGTDCAPLLWREVLREWGALEFSSCRLWYLCVQRLARQIRASVRLVIYPFENHPWEKMLCLAFRAEAPEVSLVGYQHSCVSPLLLNYGLGQGELDGVHLPDVVVANGPLSCALLHEAGWRPPHVRNGGALRYEYLLSPGSRCRKRAGTPPRVLITLPLSQAQAAALVQDLVDVFSAPLDISGWGRVEFVLKGHPRLPMRKWLTSRRSLPVWCSVTKDPLGALWQDVDAVLYTPPTASWLEAYAAGLPVVKYVGELLDTDPTGWSPDGAVARCSRDTVRSTLERLLGDGPVSVNAAQRQREVSERIFSPVQEDVWLALAQSTRVEISEAAGPLEAHVA